MSKLCKNCLGFQWLRVIGLSLAGLCLSVSGSFAQSSIAATLYATADVVFTGQLLKINPSPTGISAQFRIAQLIKGHTATDKVLQIDVPAQSRCHALEEDHSYLVYGRRIGEALWLDPCEGSKLVSLAEADLRYIHTKNPKVSERCRAKHLAELAAKAPIVATAEVVGTEDSLRTSPWLFFRPWCGLVFTTEDAYYRVRDILKGQLSDSKIVVEHPICWDTVTVDGYNPRLSPELFKEGNVLMLFLRAGSHQSNKEIPSPFQSVYEDLDENCGAVLADGEAAQSVAGAMRASPEAFRLAPRNLSSARTHN
jgi:hypothetical protein